LQAKIDAHDPGLLLALTEYNYGGGQDISGGVAEADVLGIVGRYGVYAATLWELSSNEQFIYGALDMYRNYDGAGGAFGNVGISATTSDVARTSVYASVDFGSDQRMVLVALNKTDSSLTCGVAITHTRRFSRAKVYRLTAASATPANDTDLALGSDGTFQVVLPPYSVSTLVLLPSTNPSHSSVPRLGRILQLSAGRRVLLGYGSLPPARSRSSAAEGIFF
jgi:hypothetical protein